MAALEGKPLAIDTANLPETNRFFPMPATLSAPSSCHLDGRSSAGTKRMAARKSPSEWIRQGSPSLEPLLTGCAWQPLLADAYHSACRQADRAPAPIR
ncbi:MAG: DUF2863 family protein [Azonexus sp.]